MDFDKVVWARRSTREFKGAKASWKYVLEAIDAAIQAPAAGNHSSLKFLIVEDPKKIYEIAGHADQHWIAQAGIVVLVLSDDTHLENLYGERGRVYSRQQAGAAIQNLLLKLTDLELAACWVGAYTDELIKELLNIPQHIQIEAIIPIGYPKTKAHGPKPLKSKLENVLRWENWNNHRRPVPVKDPVE